MNGGRGGACHVSIGSQLQRRPGKWDDSQRREHQRLAFILRAEAQKHALERESRQRAEPMQPCAGIHQGSERKRGFFWTHWIHHNTVAVVSTRNGVEPASMRGTWPLRAGASSRCHNNCHTCMTRMHRCVSHLNCHLIPAVLVQPSGTTDHACEFSKMQGPPRHH